MSVKKKKRHLDLQIDANIANDVDYYVSHTDGLSKYHFYELAAKHYLDFVHGKYDMPSATMMRLNQLIDSNDQIIRLLKQQDKTNTVGFNSILMNLNSFGANGEYLKKSGDDNGN